MNREERPDRVNAIDSLETPSIPDPVTLNEPSPGDEERATPAANPRYPLNVLYCPVCTFPAELHEYHSASQFEK